MPPRIALVSSSYGKLRLRDDTRREQGISTTGFPTKSPSDHQAPLYQPVILPLYESLTSGITVNIPALIHFDVEKENGRVVRLV